MSPHAPRRVEGIDVARGVAALTMILGHAFDAWVSPAGRETLGYAAKRFAGTFPLPTFLVLAGVAVAWRVGSAVRRGEAAREVRARVIRRGLEIVATGYAANLVYGIIDGSLRLDTLLRVDVLHVIGLSIAIFAWAGIRAGERAAGADAAPDAGRLSAAALGLGSATVLLCPWLTRRATALEGPLRHALAWLVEVPGHAGEMPFVPLAGWFALGLLVGRAMLHARRGLDRIPRSGTSSAFLVRLTLAGVALACVGALATRGMLRVWPGSFDRAHPVIWANVVDLGGRALALVGFAALASNHLRGRARAALLAFGRHSLTAYVFHIPFTYGRFGRPWRGQLDVAEALVGVVLLWTLSLFAIVVWARVRDASSARVRARAQRGASVPRGERAHLAPVSRRR